MNALDVHDRIATLKLHIACLEIGLNVEPDRDTGHFVGMLTQEFLRAFVRDQRRERQSRAWEDTMRAWAADANHKHHEFAAKTVERWDENMNAYLDERESWRAVLSPEQWRAYHDVEWHP